MPTSTSLSVPLLCYEDLLAAALPQLQQQQAAGGFRWTQVDEFDACGMCYTSGTTGNPKVRAAWVNTHAHPTYAACATAAAPQATPRCVG